MDTEAKLLEVTKLLNQVAAVADFLLSQQGLVWSNDLNIPVSREGLQALRDGTYANKSKSKKGAR